MQVMEKIVEFACAGFIKCEKEFGTVIYDFVI